MPSARECRRDRQASIVAILLALSAWLPTVAAAEPARWHAELPVYLTTTMLHQRSDDTRDSRSIASILAELQIRPGSRPWSIGPVIEIHRTVSGGDDTAIGSGIIFRHYRGRWDTTAIAFRHMPRHAANTWNYGARLRYRITSMGKLGAETYGVFGRERDSSLWLGYYGDVTRSFSYRLLAGSSIDRRNERLLRLDLVLQVN